MNETLLQVSDLKMFFPIRSGLLLRQTGTVYAVNGVSFDLAAHETLGLVGESGCGKSTVARTIVRIYEASGGTVRFEGNDINQMSDEQLNEYRKNTQMIFQDPYSSLNPRMTVGQILDAPLRVHGLGSSKERQKRINELLDQVRLGSWAAGRYPHEFSGGQRQRIAIARAIALKPRLVVADEPVSALDVSVQSQVLNLMKDLQEEMGMAYLFISHDLAVVRHMSDRIAVMYLGHIMEYASREDLFNSPQHPYTFALLAANPVPGEGKKKNRDLLTGDVPSPVNPPSGCVFHPRCQYAENRCKLEVPKLRQVLHPGAASKRHWAACHFYEEIQQGQKVPVTPRVKQEEK